jgi:nucleotide-binding universal stress UspA family protein
MNILYATDGSDCACTAGRLLASLPLPVDSRITVLSAVPGDDWVESMTFIDKSRQEYRLTHELARRHAEGGTALLGECGAPVVCRIGGEDAAAAILERAQTEHTDLIVVGSHCKKMVERFLVGSVSEHVARYAQTSVLVARGDRVARVIAGIDGSESSEEALDALARLPLPAEVSVTVVFVAPTRESARHDTLAPRFGDEGSIERYEAEAHGSAERIVDHAVQRLRAAGRAAEGHIRRGAPAEQLIAAAQEMEAELVVVGSANRPALGRLFLGSVSARVLHQAACSVLVARLAPRPAIDEAPALAVSGASI